MILGLDCEFSTEFGSRRGHNLALEIQATMLSTFKHPALVPMWRGTKVANLLIAMCLFPIAIGGFWAYGNLMPTGAMLNALYAFQIYGVLAATFLLVVFYCLSSFQIYSIWTFRHVFRGSPKRHLLNEGWSKFVVRKKLVAGDAVVFVKKENGGIQVGIRRMKGGAEHNTRRRIREESVIEAMRLASCGQAFEIEYYPGAGTFEYCVKAELVREATLIPWCPGMKFKIAVESNDHSRISWFMGTITGVEGNLLWKQLEVRWEKARGLLEDVKRVNP